jgi:iron-sulfur cluster repair protein YtfE (RIC family)
MNALDMLKKDHETVKGLLEQLEDTTERAIKKRTELFAKLKEELTTHETIEEEIFYPALREHEEAREIVNEAYEEHQVVDYVVEDMSQMEVGEEAWTAKLAVAKENILHHIEEEEGEMFKRAREAFDRGELEDLAVQMDERKQALHSEA